MIDGTWTVPRLGTRRHGSGRPEGRPAGPAESELAARPRGRG